MRASEKQAETAVKHDISPGTLSELIQLFIDGKPETEEELRKSPGEFVRFFSNERIHQGPDYITPDEAYENGLAGA